MYSPTLNLAMIVDMAIRKAIKHTNNVLLQMITMDQC